MSYYQNPTEMKPRAGITGAQSNNRRKIEGHIWKLEKTWNIL